MKHTRLRRLRRSTALLAAMAIAGFVGYRVHDYRRTAQTVSAVTAAWDLDYFVRPESFSEVEATRAELEGLAFRYRTEVRTRFLSETDSVVPAVERRSIIIRELEAALEEFRNAPGEPYIAQDLLLLLKRAGHYDRWLNVYLDLLYRRPTEEVIALFAPEAQDLGSATGRAAEVNAALRHVMEIPIPFPAKNRLTFRELHVTALKKSDRESDRAASL